MTVCLSMIVKNEAPVIARCLASVRPIIDHWVIVDTGSTDGTQAVIREAFADLPGTLHERPWQDFATNRTEALELAQPHADYALFIDADDTLDYDADFTLPPLDADSYEIETVVENTHFIRACLAKNTLTSRWRCVLREFVCCDEGGQGRLSGVRMLRNHKGARRRAIDISNATPSLLQEIAYRHRLLRTRELRLIMAFRSCCGRCDQL